MLPAIAPAIRVPVGALFVSAATGAAGIVLGASGYALGARRPGAPAVALCAASVFVGPLVGRGVIPVSFDRAVDGRFRNTPTERFTEDQ